MNSRCYYYISRKIQSLLIGANPYSRVTSFLSFYWLGSLFCFVTGYLFSFPGSGIDLRLGVSLVPLL